MPLNLPTNTNTEPVTISKQPDVKMFFDKFYQKEISFPANEIDAAVGFFLRRGFDDTSARSTAIVILNQAKIDGVGAFQLLDSLKKLTDVQLSQIVAQVINAYREKVSILGYRITPPSGTFESRNILF